MFQASGYYLIVCQFWPRLPGFPRSRMANVSESCTLYSERVKARGNLQSKNSPLGLSPSLVIPRRVSGSSGIYGCSLGTTGCGVRILHPDTSSVSRPSMKPIRNRYRDVKYRCQARWFLRNLALDVVWPVDNRGSIIGLWMKKGLA